MKNLLKLYKQHKDKKHVEQQEKATIELLMAVSKVAKSLGKSIDDYLADESKKQNKAS